MQRRNTFKKERCKKAANVCIVLIMIINLILVAPIKIYGETLGSGFHLPIGVAIDSSGKIYIADEQNNTIKRMDSDGNNIETLGSGFQEPSGVAVDSSGNIYVADFENNAIKRMDSDGNNIVTLGSGFYRPGGVAIDCSGKIYIADAYNHAIKRMDSDGNNIETLGSGFRYPVGVAVDSSGNIYVADMDNNEVKRMDSDGNNITTLGSGFSKPIGVAVDSGGNIYVADSNNNEVKRMDSNGGNITTLGSEFNSPEGVAVDISGNVYVADTYNSAVKKLPAPKIISVAVPSDKTYKAGDTLFFGLIFDSAVAVDSSGGTPGLSLTVGSAAKTAAYTGGSGTSSLTFRYTVQPGDSDTDGITVNGMSLNGGTISSSDNVYANLTLNNVPPTRDVLVNGVIPSFTGNSTAVTVRKDVIDDDISDLFHVSDTAANHTLTWSISAEPSHGTVTINNGTGASGGGDIAPVGNIDYSPTNGYCGTDSFTIQVSDEDGNKSTKTVNVTVADLPEASTASASSIITTSASLNGTVNANYADTTVSFEYGTSASFGNTIAASGGAVTGGNSTAVSAAVSGLSPNTTYYYRIKAHNNYGECYSSYQTFTTLALPQIQTTSPTSATVGSAYSYTFTSTGGTGGNNYSITSGSLPAGLNLSSDGTLSGTPIVHGTYRFEVTVTDNLEEQSSNTFTLYVDQKFMLTYNAGSNGSIRGSTSQTVSYGSDGTSVNAVPDTGYHFVKWSDNVLTASRQDKGISNNINATAEFAINTNTVTFEDYDGTVIGTPQTINYGAGATAPANNPTRTGYSFVGWDKTFNDVTGDLVVTATYSINQYTLKYTAESHGTITGTTTQAVNYGSDGTSVTAVPDTGYHFVKWSDNVLTASRQDKGISNNINVNAEFAINTNTVTFEDYDGTVIGTPQTINYGAGATAPANNPTRTGYSFAGWDKTFNDVTGDLVVTAMYSINQYTLKYTAEPHGTITGTTTQAVNYGSDGTSVTAVPDTGYHFVKWSDNVITASRQDKGISNNINATAEFAINTNTVTFEDYDGTVIGTPQTINYGAGAVAPTNPTRTGYSFAGWDKAFDNITGNLTVTAEYTSGGTYIFTANAASQNADEATLAEGYFDSRDNTLIVNNNGVTFTIPAVAVDITGISDTDYVRTTEKAVEGSDEDVLVSNLPDNMQIVGSPLEFDLQLYNSSNILIREIHQFANSQKVKVSIKLTSDELKNLDTGKLSAYYYDENTKQWVELGGSFGSIAQEITFMTPHFTKFAIMEKVSTASNTVPSVNTNTNVNANSAADKASSGKLVQTGSLFDFDMLICLGSILLLAGVIQIGRCLMIKSKDN